MSLWSLLAANAIPIGVVVSLINIFITLANWYRSRPRLEFYKSDGRQNFYRGSYPKEYGYKDSNQIAFVYVEIANLSALPCTISEFSMSSLEYPDSFYRSTHKVFDRYNLGKLDTGNECFVLADTILKIPCTLPPFGFACGLLVFPYCPNYQGNNIPITITARTSKKRFCFNTNLDSWEYIRSHRDRQLEADTTAHLYQK